MALLEIIARAARRTTHAGMFRRGGAMLVFVFACLGPAATGISAAPVPSREYQIKAVFLFNFVQFVEWPAATFPDASAPIRIGVLGDDPFGPALDEAVRGERIGGRALVVKRAQRLEEMEDCQLVFVAKSEGQELGAHLERLKDKPVLTVGDAEDFARRGGGIAFYPEGKKIRFAINVGVARRLGLKISSELLKLGKIVGDVPAPEDT